MKIKLLLIAIGLSIITNAFADTIVFRANNENMCRLSEGTTEYATYNEDLGQCIVGTDGEPYVNPSPFARFLGYNDVGVGSNSYFHVPGTNTYTLTHNSTRVTFPIDSAFTYKKGNFTKNYSLYNIDDLIYMPLDLFAHKSNGSYCITDDAYIVYTDDDAGWRYLDSTSNKLTPTTQLRLYQFPFENSCKTTAYYQYSTGEIVNNIEGASEVVRLCDTAYAVIDGLLYTKDLSKVDSKPQRVTFTNFEGMLINAYVCNLVAIDNKIYGISPSEATECYGRVFSCRADGTDFKYITSFDASNLIYVEDFSYGYKYNLYFLDHEAERSLYVYDISYDDCYKMRIFDKNGKNMVADAVSVVVLDKCIAILSSDRKALNILNLETQPGRCEWIKMWDASCVIKLSATKSGAKFTSIGAINADPSTNTIYLVNDEPGDVGAVYSYNIKTREMERIIKADFKVDNISLYLKINGTKVIQAENYETGKTTLCELD